MSKKSDNKSVKPSSKRPKGSQPTGPAGLSASLVGGTTGGQGSSSCAQVTPTSSASRGNATKTTSATKTASNTKTSASCSRTSCCSCSTTSCNTSCYKTSCCSKTCQTSKGSIKSSAKISASRTTTKAKTSSVSVGKASTARSTGTGKPSGNVTGTQTAQSKTKSVTTKKPVSVQSQKSGNQQAASTPVASKGDASIESVSTVFKKDPKMEALFKKKHYKVLKSLAHGAFGQVYKGARTNDQDEPLMDKLVAIKMVEMTRLGPAFREKYLPQELAAITHVKHENVVRVLDIFRANNKLFIIMEFAPNGDIAGYLKKNGPMQERLAKFWFGQVVNALAFFHRELRMAHRDIKVDNVLLDDQHNAKLSDFGFAKECWDSKRHCAILSHTICGTMPYFSPQLVDKVPYNAYMADAWAMGVTCFVMLNYRFPFHYDVENPAVWLVEMASYPSFIKTRFIPTISAKAIEFNVALLNPNEKERMTLHEAQKHEWLTSCTDKNAPLDSK